MVHLSTIPPYQLHEVCRRRMEAMDRLPREIRELIHESKWGANPVTLEELAIALQFCDLEAEKAVFADDQAKKTLLVRLKFGISDGSDLSAPGPRPTRPLRHTSRGFKSR